MLHLNWINTYECSYPCSLIFPTWIFLLPGLSCWLYFWVPSGLPTVSSLSVVRFPATPSVTFALVSPPMWKKNILEHFYGMHTHFRDAVLSCPFLLKLCLSRHLAHYLLSSHTQSYTTLMRNSSWSSETALWPLFVSYSLCLSTYIFFPLPVSLMFPSLAYLPYDKCILCLIITKSVWEQSNFCGAGLLLD